MEISCDAIKNGLSHVSTIPKVNKAGKQGRYNK